MTTTKPTAKKKSKEFEFTIDDRPFETDERRLTARQLLVDFAALDPGLFYLVELDGAHQHSFQEHLDEEINIKKHAKFITVSLGPTPVS